MFNFSKFSKKSFKGFTMIELLIAIAVIAILSAIIISSASSVLKKSRNAKRLIDIKNYATAFDMALLENGEYPDTGDTNFYCLGEGYPNGNCWYNNNFSENDTLKSNLEKYIGLPIDTYQMGSFMGYIYKCAERPNDICTNIEVKWLLEGKIGEVNEPCGIGIIGAIINGDTTTYCIYKR